MLCENPSSVFCVRITFFVDTGGRVYAVCFHRMAGELHEIFIYLSVLFVEGLERRQIFFTDRSKQSNSENVIY